MGLFEIRRRLAAEARATAEQAARAAAEHRDDPAQFLADAWAHVRDPRHVVRLYAARARDDADTALALARLAADDPPALGALADEQRALIAPRVAADLFADHPRRAAARLVDLGDPRVVAPALELAASTADEHLRLALADVAATWGDAAAREAAALWLPAGFAPLTVTLARHGHPAARASLVTGLRDFLNAWLKGGRTPTSAWKTPFALVDAIAAAQVADAVPLLLAALPTPLVARALRALARLATPRAREPARALLRELGGTQRARTYPYRLAAEACLAALGEPHPTTTARAALAVRPVRYGWPRLADTLELRDLALAALVDRGDEADRELVARGVDSPHRFVRAHALAALARLGRPAPPPRWLDAPRCATLDTPALIAALADPHAILKHVAARALADRDDPAARDAALTWALAHLEASEDPDDGDRDDLGPEPAAAREILDVLKASHQGRIAASATQPDRDEPPLSGPWRAAIRRLDRAPFVFGAPIHGLALDPSATRLAVVGERPGRIFDARTGEPLLELPRASAPARDCAFAPDGSVLAVACRDHVVLFDPATGAHLRTLVVPGEATTRTLKCLAFSPDGDRLAFAASDGRARVVLWRTGEAVWDHREDGAAAAVACSPDGAACLFSHVQTSRKEFDSLVRVALDGSSARRIVDYPGLYSLAAAPGRWFAGDRKKIRVLAEDFAAARNSLVQAGVVRLAVAPDGSLLAASTTGRLQRWDLARKRPTATTLLADGAALAALAVAPDGAVFAAGAAGVVRRFTAADDELHTARVEAHDAQVAGLAPLPDGTTLTCAWDGRLLRWSADFAAADVVLRHPSRLTCLLVDPSATTAYAGAVGCVLVVDLATTTARAIDLDEARADDLALVGDRLHVAASDGRVHSFHAADLTPRGAVSVGRAATAVAATPTGTLLVGTVEGLLLELDADMQVVWSRAEFGRDLVDKDPHGNPHRSVVGLAAHTGRFAAAATDDTLRVFDRTNLRRTLRLLTDLGLFNNCDLAPDGRLVAATGDGLAVFDATSGALLVHLRASAFPGADELTVFTFTAPRRALVGAKNGALFEVTLEPP